MRSNNFSIDISSPCDKKWNELSKVEKDRFCESCAKKVIDFSKMKHNQIVDYVESQNERVCGRLTTNQIENKSFKLIYASRLKAVLLSFAAITVGKNLYSSSTYNILPNQITVKVNPTDSLNLIVKGTIIDKKTKNKVHTKGQRRHPYIELF